MIRFECDYLEGAHPAILEKLAASNLAQAPGYGLDDYCETARRHILRECKTPDADVHFLVGGTQANTVMIASILRPHQAALSPVTGHINGHETGAIEATGHKVVTMPETNGKIDADTVRRAHAEHWNDRAHEHIPQPGLVYISHPTEHGTLYTRLELEQISAACHTLGLPLVLDGARLGYGLAAPGSDVGLPELAVLCDMFTIGGTKVGALAGEAVVITNPSLKKDFRYLMKQRGGMLAKGRLLGLQFEALFEDGLYYSISRHADAMAERIRECLDELRVGFRYPPESNQLFPVLSNRSIAALTDRYSFSLWERLPDGERSVIRICTSWATTRENVETLLADLRALPSPL